MNKRFLCTLLALVLTLSCIPFGAHAAPDVLDSYIAENITATMTVPQKLDAICRFVAGYDYSDRVSTMKEMLASGAGNSYAGSQILLSFCEKLGITAWLRDASRDGNGTQVNVLVSAGGKYYQLETGFREIAPRPYEITERTSLFSYSYTEGGICVYQYDGTLSETLTVPGTIDGYGVVAIGEQFLASRSGVKTVILPDSLVTIGADAFNSCADLQTLAIPAAVREIGERAFAGCDRLSGLSCSGSAYFAVSDHVLYTKDMSQVVAAPYCKNAFLANSVTLIRPYAFMSSGNLQSAVIPANVTAIGEGAFGDCSELSLITFLGDQPRMEDFLFFGVTADAYASWEHSEGYNGQITWKRHTPAATVSAQKDAQSNIVGLSVNVWAVDGKVTVLVPVVLPHTTAASSAIPISVSVPQGSTVTLNMILQQPGSGCVVLRKAADGNYAVAPDTVVTEDGVQLTVTESCSLAVIDGSISFPDVGAGHWAKAEIDYMTARGILNGKLDGTFGHAETITRKTVAMILWRMAGSPAVDVDSRLTDVNLSDRYTQAICWAEDAGIITGYADGTFRGDDTLTRQHFAVMLYRYALYSRAPMTPENDKLLTEFSDYADIYTWAKDATAWAVQNGLINGRADGRFDPQGGTSRAQLAVILTRYLKKAS